MTLLISNNNKELVFYFLIAYAFSWILWFPVLLFSNGIISGSYEVFKVLGIIGSFGPFVAATLLTLKNEGKVGLKNLYKRTFQVKLGWWWVPVLFVIPAGVLIAHLLNILFFNATFPITEMLLNPWLIPVFFFIMLIIGGPLAEEFGWRGYAQFRLENNFNALNSGIILGIIWSLWHIPLFLMIGQPQHDYIPFWIFMVTDVLFSVYMIWLMNNTKKSLIPAFFIHNWMNISFVMFALMEPKAGGNYIPWLLSIIILAIILVFVVKIYGAESLSKKENQEQ